MALMYIIFRTESHGGAETSAGTVMVRFWLRICAAVDISKSIMKKTRHRIAARPHVLINVLRMGRMSWSILSFFSVKLN